MANIHYTTTDLSASTGYTGDCPQGIYLACPHCGRAQQVVLDEDYLIMSRPNAIEEEMNLFDTEWAQSAADLYLEQAGQNGSLRYFPCDCQ